MPTSDIVLSTRGLSKRYGRLMALDGLDLEVPRGTVYGFLGPNGAGKTTAISLILGLIAPSAGQIELFGLDSRSHLAEALRRTGAILEGQTFYPLLSARENLQVWAGLSGDVPDTRIDEMLEFVGLAERSRDQVRTFSQGMKQRLGLATALLHDPDLLVLDEPTNGLDPAGMREFRDLIRGLPERGKTVFVSSHLLGEVEQMCTDVGIVKDGKLITQGSVASLVRGGAMLEVRTTDNERAAQILERLTWVVAVTRDGDLLEVEAPPERAADISRELAGHEIYISELRAKQGSLEDFFLEVTGEPAPSDD
ncbi:MAG: ABC transporter ATP-binding protein [Chloroflexi bacterium]|nr:ABC transporter ATP-binding protein [Chloroflexota bacterium]